MDKIKYQETDFDEYNARNLLNLFIHFKAY